MALFATKDGMAKEPVGQDLVERYVFKGDRVPDHWQYDAVEERDVGDSVVYAAPPYESPRRGMLGPDEADSSHAGMAANQEAREKAAERAAKDRSSSRSSSK